MAGDVLSQSEIDELLSALSTGTVSADEIKTEQEQKKIKIYDFKRPDKFSKDQIRTLYMIHENFARLLNTYLSAHLRSMVNIEVASVDQLTYEEYIRSLPNPTVISIFQLPPLKGNAVFEINPALVFAMIDRLFGGVGGTFNKSRSLTDIEEAIVTRLMVRALDQFMEAWKQVIDIKPSLDTLESNPQFTQIVPPNDMVVIITMQAKIMHTEGLMTLCIPYLVLEPIMNKLTTTFWVASSSAKKEMTENTSLQRGIIKTPIPVSVQLGKTDINVYELMNLNIGDVLPLDTYVDGDLTFVVGQKPKFKCRPGLSGKRLAVQITSPYTNKGDEQDE